MLFNNQTIIKFILLKGKTGGGGQVKIKVHISVSILLITMPIIIYISGCSKADENVPRIREAVINYMSDPAFINSDFTRQLTSTEAELQMYNVDEKMLYFSIPKKDFDSSTTIRRLCNNLSVVEFGKEENGRIYLGKYSLLGSDKFFFRFSKDDFKIDTAKIIRIEFGNYYYTVSMNELADFSFNKSIYGGKLDLLPGEIIKAANHGAMVAKKDEPSLMRLVSQITGGETINEKIAQMLLNFVSGSLKYNDKEAIGKYEILKRPNEVLMTGKSDCSGLVILYASLLEQAGIDYQLLYYTGHISVGVEGDFPKTNKLNFELNGKTFFIAETTAKDFVIGESLLSEEIDLRDIKYTQKPGVNSELIKYK